MDEIRASEINEIIRKQIENFETGVTVMEVGTVIKIGDGIAELHGLEKVMAGELLEFPNDVRGLALNLEEDKVGAVLFGDFQTIREGDLVKRTGRIMEVLWVTPLSGAWSTASAIRSMMLVRLSQSTSPVERIAPGVVDRQPVKEPLQTGLKAIDAMVPIGRGQRELIIGDRQTGKTAVAVDTIINQKGKDVICIYVAIGQKASTVAQVVKTLQDFGAMDYTIVIKATASIRRCSSSRLIPARRWASTSATMASTHSRFTTIFPTGRRVSRSLCCCDVHRAAKLIPATSFTCTRACWNEPQNSPTLKVAVH